MFEIKLDLSQLIGLNANVKEKATTLVQEAARRLAAQTHAHIVEKVQEKLHSTRNLYKQNLKFKPINENVNLIVLEPGAMFLEEGMAAHEMIDDLLKGPSDKIHTAKDGSKWRVIPFKQNNAPQDTPESVADLQSAVKKYMRKNKIPYGKIENNSDGSPKLGLLHTFNIDAPVKTTNGPGQGWGPVGEVKQGPTGIPFLQGVKVYQRASKDDAGRDVVRKDIMTFRIVSSKHKGTGRWMHPGIPAHRFFDEAYNWALDQWEKEIKPDIEDEIAG
jgi:hypothetical protein